MTKTSYIITQYLITKTVNLTKNKALSSKCPRNVMSLTFDSAWNPELKDLCTATSHLNSETINRFNHMAFCARFISASLFPPRPIAPGSRPPWPGSIPIITLHSSFPYSRKIKGTVSPAPRCYGIPQFADAFCELIQLGFDAGPAVRTPPPLLLHQRSRTLPGSLHPRYCSRRYRSSGHPPLLLVLYPAEP